MTQKLDTEAMGILINLAPRIGATPKGRVSTEGLARLQRAGCLGQDYGLTEKGLKARRHEYERRLDAAF